LLPRHGYSLTQRRTKECTILTESFEHSVAIRAGGTYDIVALRGAFIWNG
jgi:hypothetical protein